MIMYEMYPDAWPTAVEARQHSILGDKPRRRVRREHSVMPPVIAQATSERGADRSA